MTPDQTLQYSIAATLSIFAICITTGICVYKWLEEKRVTADKANYNELRKTALQSGFGEVPVKTTTTTTKTETTTTETMNVSWQKDAGKLVGT
jgi:hypothetical protein